MKDCSVTARGSTSTGQAPSSSSLARTRYRGRPRRRPGRQTGFEKGYESSAGKPLIVGLDVGPVTGLGSHEDAARLLRQLAIRNPAAYAVDDSALRSYRINAMPTTLFFDDRYLGGDPVGDPAPRLRWLASDTSPLNDGWRPGIVAPYVWRPIPTWSRAVEAKGEPSISAARFVRCAAVISIVDSNHRLRLMVGTDPVVVRCCRENRAAPRQHGWERQPG